MENEDHSNISLQVFFNDQLIFQSEGKWLYPLFELESHLKNHPINVSQALVKDKVVGKAAALLIIRLGAGHIHGTIMSDLAIDTLSSHNLPFSFDTRVPRIDCKTEKLLENIDDPEIAYAILRERAHIN